MNIAAEKKAFDAALDKYRQQLDGIDDDTFTQTPLQGGWSYAEVYSHIMQADLGSSIAMQKCMQGNAKPDGKRPNWRGHLVLLLGRLPKAQASASVANRMPARKINKEEARNLIIKVRKRVDELLPLLEEASPKCNIAHPALGHFNAFQWLRFIRLHTEHHLKQLRRIDAALASGEN